VNLRNLVLAFAKKLFTLYFSTINCYYARQEHRAFLTDSTASTVSGVVLKYSISFYKAANSPEDAIDSIRLQTLPVAFQRSPLKCIQEQKEKS